MKCYTLNEAFIYLLENHPEKTIGYIQRNGTIYFVSIQETYSKSLRILQGLRNNDLGKGDKVLLVLENNSEIIPVFWACILGGIIPSVLQVPISFSNQSLALQKIQSASKLLNNPRIILSESSELSGWFSTEPSSVFIKYDYLVGQSPTEDIVYSKPDDHAYIQFSSGSTGNPKGIMLTHRNILANIHDITVTNELNAESISVNWMPLYHDMGLVGFHLTLIYAHSWQYFIDVIDFVKNPLLWLNALSELKADTTGSPNFGQALTLRHFERNPQGFWDFSRIRNFFNGAEPISAAIMNRFIIEMSAFGFKETAMIPCYGMAEATLAVSMRNKVVPPVVKMFNRKALYLKGEAIETHDKQNALTIVGVGQAMGHNMIRIIDDGGNALAEGKVGQIQISGLNVTSQFYNPDYNTDDISVNGWLNTGDMGFLHKGELFITGRIKDLIFVNGQNYYAHDLEQVVTSVKNELYGKIAICALFDEDAGQDKLIVFVVGPQSVKSAEKYESVKLLLNLELGLQPDEIIPIKSSEMPRTSSGKLQRYKLTESYQQGIFKDYLKF